MSAHKIIKNSMTFEHRVLILSMYVGRFEAELLVEDREYLTRAAAAAGSEGAAGKSYLGNSKTKVAGIIRSPAKKRCDTIIENDSRIVLRTNWNCHEYQHVACVLAKHRSGKAQMFQS